MFERLSRTCPFSKFCLKLGVETLSFIHNPTGGEAVAILIRRHRSLRTKYRLEAYATLLSRVWSDFSRPSRRYSANPQPRATAQRSIGFQPVSGRNHFMFERLSWAWVKIFRDRIEIAWHTCKLCTNSLMIGAELPHQACVGFYREKTHISS